MTDTTLKTQLQEDMKQAMRAKESQRLNAIRLILAAVKQIEVDQRIVVDNQTLLGILDKMAKQRRDSISQFQAASRQDLVDQEQFELNIIQAYMPTQITEAELDQLIADVIASTQAQSIKDMGKAMNALKPQILGRTDMAVASSKLKQQLEQLD